MSLCGCGREVRFVARVLVLRAAMNDGWLSGIWGAA